MFTFPTIIEEGSNINIVPGIYKAYGDIKVLPEITKKIIEEKIKEKLNKLNINYKLVPIVLFLQYLLI